MALQIVWTSNAQEHLVEILKYWEHRNGSKSYSFKLHKLFQKGLEVLSNYPETGTKTSHTVIRKKTITAYFVYYSFDERSITVLGIVDMRRNPKFIRKFE